MSAAQALDDEVIIQPQPTDSSNIDPIMERDMIIAELLKYLSIRVGMTVKQKIIQNQPLHQLELKLFKHI